MIIMKMLLTEVGSIFYLFIEKSNVVLTDLVLTIGKKKRNLNMITERGAGGKLAERKCTHF